MIQPAQLEEAMAAARRVVEQLKLPLGARSWKGQAGEFKGAGVGSSIDFQDHRDYAPGDDPRHINWQAFARTGQYSMKLYREEVRPVLDLLVDVSDSMWVGNGKALRTAELLYFFTLGAERHGASLSVHLVKGEEARAIPTDFVLTHRWIQEVESMNGGEEVPQLVRAGLRANAIRILISDLLFEAEPGFVLRNLHDRQGTGLVFSPFTRKEENPEWRGQYDFIEAEKGTRHSHQISASALQRYRNAYQRHFALWQEECRKHQVILSRVASEGDLLTSLNREAIRFGALEVMP
ncbi:MAG: DUF58 domain-containing protein [Akkermansiaceae bacterium]